MSQTQDPRASVDPQNTAGGPVALTWNSDQTAFSNISDFVTSMFNSGTRATSGVTAAISSGALVHPYCDTTSRGMILNAWLEAWKNAAATSPTPSQCPETDFYLLQFLAGYIQGIYDTQGYSMCLAMPDLVYVPGVADADGRAYYLNRGYRAVPFITAGTWSYGAFDAAGNVQDPDQDGAAVANYLFLLFHGAHVAYISASADTGLNPPSFYDSFKTTFLDSTLPNVGLRSDFMNSHYGAPNWSGYYYLDIDEMEEPSYQPLICAFLAGQSAHQDQNQNTFTQLEGWPASVGNNDWHMADYDSNTATLWNFGTYGCSVYAEKRCATCFIAPPDFALAINPTTHMPLYGGAGSTQGWMLYNYALYQEPSLPGQVTWAPPALTGPQASPSDGYSLALCDHGAVVVWSDGSRLYYTTGIWRNGTIQWASWADQYDTGDQVKIAMNNNGVVEVHQDNAGSFRLYVNAGVVDWSTGLMQWGKAQNIHNEKGQRPAVAIDANNNVIEVHVEQSGSGPMWSRYGTATFNGSSSSVSLVDSTAMGVDGENPSIAWNGGDRAVVTQTVAGSNSDYSVLAEVGTVSWNNGTVSGVQWGSAQAFGFDDYSLLPQVVMTQSGQLVTALQFYNSDGGNAGQSKNQQFLTTGLILSTGQGTDSLGWGPLACAPGYSTEASYATSSPPVAIAALRDQVVLVTAGHTTIGTLGAPLPLTSVTTGEDPWGDLQILGLLDTLATLVAWQASNGVYTSHGILPGQVRAVTQICTCRGYPTALYVFGLTTQGKVGISTWQDSTGSWHPGREPFVGPSDRYCAIAAAPGNQNWLQVVGLNAAGSVDLVQWQNGTGIWSAGVSLPPTAPAGVSFTTIQVHVVPSLGLMVLALGTDGRLYLASWQDTNGHWHAGQVLSTTTCTAFTAGPGTGSSLQVIGLATDGHPYLLATVSATAPWSTQDTCLDQARSYTAIGAAPGDSGRLQVVGLTGGLPFLAGYQDTNGTWKAGGAIAAVSGVSFATLCLASGSGGNVQVLCGDDNGSLYLASWQNASTGHWSAGNVIG